MARRRRPRWRATKFAGALHLEVAHVRVSACASHFHVAPSRAASHSLLGMLAVQALGQRPVLARPARAHASARQAPAWHRGSRRARAAGAPSRADSRTVGSRAQPRPVKHLRTLRPAPGAPARRGPHRVWDERARRECPSRTAARRARRSRGAAPATMCTARPRTGQALTCPPTPALSPRALGLQTRCEGRARPRRFARARAYAPGAGQRRSGGRPLRATAWTL